jgi:heptaprenylglyceryl phosphate synthase
MGKPIPSPPNGVSFHEIIGMGSDGVLFGGGVGVDNDTNSNLVSYVR